MEPVEFAVKSENEIPVELRGFIPGYVARRLEDIEVMRRHLERRDFHALGMVVHKIKGNAASFGLYRVYGLVLQLQTTVDAEDGPESERLINALEREIAKLEREVSGADLQP
ncbi:MAG: Hpt domain-containing protein [Bdellovibrionaceae bacterium]|nr:Hpt domain-containing protein [Pseudobdellovibrionaceae bacterium]